MSTHSIKNLLTKKQNSVQEHVVHCLHVIELCRIVSEYDQNLILFRLTSQQPITRRCVFCFSCKEYNCVIYDTNEFHNYPFTICSQGHVEIDLLAWMTPLQIRTFLWHETTVIPMLNFFVNVVEFEECFRGNTIYSANSNPRYFISSETACSIYQQLN